MLQTYLIAFSHIDTVDRRSFKALGEREAPVLLTVLLRLLLQLAIVVCAHVFSAKTEIAIGYNTMNRGDCLCNRVRVGVGCSLIILILLTCEPFITILLKH